MAMALSLSETGLSDMQHFEAPSFSLGLDEIHETFQGHAFLPSSDPSRVFPQGENQTISSTAADTETLNGAGDADDDSDFELPIPSSTNKILKRLKRKSLQSSAPPKPKQRVQPDIHAGESKGHVFQGFCNSSNEKKTNLPEKNHVRENAGSKINSLQNFWKSLNGKATSALTADFPARNDNESKTGTAQGFGKATLNLPVESTARYGDEKVGYPLEHGKTSSHMPAESFKLARESKDNTIQSFGKSTDDNICKEFTARNARCRQSMAKPLESFGNRSHDQNTSSSEEIYARNCKDNAAQSSWVDDLPTRNANQNKDTSIQISWKSLNDKERSFPDNSPARNESQCKEKVIQSFQNSLKGTMVNLPVECPGNNVSQSKVNALQSFWKSLNDKKPSLHETNANVEEDDIEDYSSADDDFEIGTQSARKLSLFGNAAVTQGFSVRNASARVSSDQRFCLQHPSNETSRVSPKSALQNAAYEFSVYPCASQSFAVRAASDETLANRQTKQVRFSEKFSEGMQRKSFPWSCDDYNNSDSVPFFSHDCNEDRAFDKGLHGCETPYYTSEAKANPFEVNSSACLDPIAVHDPRVTNLLRQRFPHFIPVSALRQGDYTGSEQIYIDYENQFAGGKNVSGHSGSMILEQQAQKTAARPAAKRTQAAHQKKQKTAMADNDGWIQTGNRTPVSIQRRRGDHGRGQRGSKTPVNTDGDFGAGTGHWVTEKTGKRIYITRDGRKLSGSSAYKQHIKDSGKRSKKTKRRRP